MKINETVMIGITVFAGFLSFALFALIWDLGAFDLTYQRLLLTRLGIFLGAGVMWAVIAALWNVADKQRRGQ